VFLYIDVTPVTGKNLFFWKKSAICLKAGILEAAYPIAS
jgi:hypothetical protein